MKDRYANVQRTALSNRDTHISSCRPGPSHDSACIQRKRRARASTRAITDLLVNYPASRTGPRDVMLAPDVATPHHVGGCSQWCGAVQRKDGTLAALPDGRDRREVEPARGIFELGSCCLELRAPVGRDALPVREQERSRRDAVRACAVAQWVRVVGVSSATKGPLLNERS